MIAFNGTVKLPLGKNGYVKKVSIYNLNTQGQEKLAISMKGYPSQIGEVTRSRENGQFMEFPVTITQFSSLIA